MGQDLIQALLVQRILKHILVGAKLHGFLHILKIIMTAENDDVYRLVLFSDPAYQLNPVHQRHGDIRHNHIRSKLLYDVQCLLAVSCIRRDLIIRPFPCPKLLQIAPYKEIIIHDYRSNHISSPFDTNIPRNELPICRNTIFRHALERIPILLLVSRKEHRDPRPLFAAHTGDSCALTVIKLQPLPDIRHANAG